MSIVLVIVAALLGIAAIGSAVQKLRRDPMVVNIMHSVGVTDRQIPILAVLEIAGAVGLIVGIWVQLIGVAAAVGLTLYFAGAVVAHLRARTPAKEAAPAGIMAILALATTLLELAR